MTIEIEVVPTSKPAIYAAVLEDGTVLRRSRQPFLAAARALLVLGHSPEEMLLARHRGRSAVAMQGTLGEAAKWTISDGDRSGLHRHPWAPFDPAVRPVRRR